MNFISDVLNTDLEEFTPVESLSIPEAIEIATDMENLVNKIDSTKRDFESFKNQVERLEKVTDPKADDVVATFEAYKESMGLPSSIDMQSIISMLPKVEKKYQEDMEGLIGDLFKKFRLWINVWESTRIAALANVEKATKDTPFKEVGWFKSIFSSMHIGGKVHKSSALLYFCNDISSLYTAAIDGMKKDGKVTLDLLEKLLGILRKVSDGKHDEILVNMKKDVLKTLPANIQGHIDLVEGCMPLGSGWVNLYVFPVDKKTRAVLSATTEKEMEEGKLPFTGMRDINIVAKGLIEKLPSGTTVGDINLNLDYLKTVLSKDRKAVFEEWKELEVILKDLEKKDWNEYLVDPEGYFEKYVWMSAKYEVPMQVLQNFVSEHIKLYKMALKIANVLDIE